jgi:ketosteroid isomerase-like protein
MNEDRQAINDLVNLYVDAVIRHDAKLWRSLWTIDAEWSLMGTLASGKQDIGDMWENAMANYPFAVHLAHPVQVITDGDTGRGRWYIQEILREAEGPAVFAFGVYTDRYQKVEGQWLFSYRRFDLMYRIPLQEEGMTLMPFPEDLDEPVG